VANESSASESGIHSAIARDLDRLRLPGVLSVRPGYEIAHGWLTGRTAIVVTVERKTPDPTTVLPTEIGGIPVDVRQASPAKRASLADPAGYAASHGPYPDLGAIPEFPDERDLTAPGAPRVAFAAARKPPKPNIQYAPPAGVELKPVTANATIHLSASPDSGWTTLSPFLAATETSLTVGLYDFTSAHVLQTVETSLAGKTFHLVLDHPARNPTADQTDEQTVAGLKSAIAENLTQAWALERMDPLATAWIFPTAYHIKVAVRDSSAFWLSSGNWNNSNQPDIDPVATPGDAVAARSADRDWHVIVEQPQLAKTFEAFILNDLAQASEHNVGAAAAASIAPAIVNANVQTPPFDEFFPATTISGEMRITPLLTPDPGVYVGAVKAAIASAKKTLYLQFQYIELPKTTDATSQAFVDLVKAVIDRQQAGVEVKIIMSEYETAGYLEQLQAAGLDVVNSVRIQNNVHNKGIVVDAEFVLVSSQNWSTDGTLYNRDAGVIIYQRDAAKYFQQIFLHDWNHLARKKVADD
jgi:hypothetical protein